MYEKGMLKIFDHNAFLLRAATTYHTQGENAGHGYEVRRHTAIQNKHNKYIPTQRFGHLKSKSAVAGRGIVRKHEVGNMKSRVRDVPLDGIIQNKPSHAAFRYGKHKFDNPYVNKYEGSNEMKVENTRVRNPKETSVLSDYKIPWQKNLSKNYPENKDNQDFRKLRRLQHSAYRSGGFDARRDSRRKSTPSADTDASKDKEKDTEPHGIKYKPPGSSFRSWKPDERRKFLESQYNKTETSSPQDSEEDTFAYEGKQQDAEREEKEELDQNLNFRNEDDEFYD
jgi:hypothetical protein